MLKHALPALGRAQYVVANPPLGGGGFPVYQIGAPWQKRVIALDRGGREDSTTPRRKHSGASKRSRPPSQPGGAPEKRQPPG